MSAKEIRLIGYMAIVMEQLTNIPQIYKNYKHKDTHDISLISLLFGTAANILWALYAYQQKDIPLMISGILGVLTFIILIVQFYMYRQYRTVHHPKKK